MKGRTIVQMINPSTKEVEKEYKNDNIITNAMKNAFSVPSQYKNQWHVNTNIQEYCKELTPFYNKGLGGILLWDEEIPENIETVYPPFNSKNVGRAGSPYSGSNSYRGTLNINETGAILSGETLIGWRNVWDFGTDKINGVTFKCLTLTHRNCGDNGWSSVVGGNEATAKIFTQQSKQIIDFGDSSTYLVAALDTNKILTAKYVSATQWTLNTFEIPKTSALKITDVEMGSFVKSADIPLTFGTSSSLRRPLNFSVYNGVAHCINILTSTTFLHTQINLSDYSVVENIKSISGSSKTLTTGDSFSRLSVVYNGYIYICNSDYSVSKHNLDGSFVGIVSGISLTAQYRVSICDEILTYVLSSSTTVSSEKVIEFNGTSVRYIGDVWQYMGSPISISNSGIKYPISLAIYGSGTNTGLTIQGSNNYLGSINNLATPIVKQSGFLMKIIYEIFN
jgi:hypothetical protein